MTMSERVSAPTTGTRGSITTVELDDEGATPVFDALSSDTARAILGALYDRPRTPSAVSDVVDTSLQNVGHHLDQLEGAGLVDVVDTEHSDQGREMSVYGPVSDSLVLYAGHDPASWAPTEAEFQNHTQPALWFGVGAVTGILASAIWRAIGRSRGD